MARTVVDVKELISMFTFQAIHNSARKNEKTLKDVKELISMFTFQAIHNTTYITHISDCKNTNFLWINQIYFFPHARKQEKKDQMATRERISSFMFLFQ